jgi:hypothetical protein
MQQTMLGIARPGIAPLRPGEHKPNEVASFQAPAELSEDELRLVRGAKSRRWPVVVAVLVVLLLAAGVAVLLVGGWLGDRGPIEAKVVLADDGSEQVELRCESCPDATEVSIGAVAGRFTGHVARLALQKPLRVGSNPLVFQLKRPGDGTGKSFSLDVPVHYRVRGDLAGLEEDPPKLKVHVEAAPKTSVVVDGKPLTLDAQGRGTYSLDVSPDVSGASRETSVLSRTVTYELAAPERPAERGDVKLQVGIVPLVVDAPGSSTVIEQANFMLAGRTQEGGSVSVAGRPISVDAKGSFAQLMSVSAPGETTVLVRAAVKGRAPRLVPVKVRRVTQLRAELADVRKNAHTSYGELLKAAKENAAEAKTAGETPSVKAVLEGKVTEARAENYITIMLMEVTPGCTHSPCLARVLLGSKVGLNSGEPITAVGEHSNLVDGPRRNEKIPELLAEFVVRGAP